MSLMGQGIFSSSGIFSFKSGISKWTYTELLFLKISNFEYNSQYHYKVSATLLNFPYSLLY